MSGDDIPEDEDHVRWTVSTSGTFRSPRIYRVAACQLTSDAARVTNPVVEFFFNSDKKRRTAFRRVIIS